MPRKSSDSYRTKPVQSAGYGYDTPEVALGRIIESTDATAAERMEMHKRGKRMLAFLDEQQQERKLNVPVIISENLGPVPATAGWQDGVRYLGLNADAVKSALSSNARMDGYLGMIGHEFVHTARKDIADDGSQPKLTREQHQKKEYLADLEGAGPLGSRNPLALAEYTKAYLVEGYNSDVQPRVKISPEQPTAEQLKQVSEWAAKLNPNHPTLSDRMAALKMQDKLMKEYEATHKVVTYEDRVAENKWVVEKVMQAIEAGTLQKPARVSTLPETVKTQLAEMQALPMAQAEGLQSSMAQLAMPLKISAKMRV